MAAQRGFAMIAILALIALISAFLIASALNRTAADVSNEREDRSMSALRKAKAALIAYAANEQWQAGGATPFQPGALPCPDRDNDGKADDHQFPQKPCNTPLKRVGRLPWQTIGADDLRDASGESLWYAVSAGFLQNTPSYTNIINSDTAGQLTVIGSIPASNVVAIVFAPGEAIQGQVRSPANANDPASYLEQFNGVTYATFTSTSVPSTINNDRLLVITQADLMAVVEPVVAANVERDLKPLMQQYFTKWGTYPFAMTFAAPPASVTAYKGTYLTPPPPPPPYGATQGLLPLTDDPTWFTWWKATVTKLPAGFTGNEIFTSPPTCSINISPPQAVCQVSYADGPPSNDDGNARPDIMISVYLQNANTSFADIPSPITAPENFTIAKNGGGFVSNQGSPYGQFSDVGSVVPTTTFVTQTGVVAETGVIVYKGRLQNAVSMNYGATITIPLPPPQYLPITSGNPVINPKGAWFISNQWYRDAYYAVSPGYVSGGGVPFGNPPACSPEVPATPPCLTVNNLAAPTNKHAIIVLAGRQLNGTTRPASGNPADYFENANLTAANGTAPFVYQHRAGLPTSINDRVVVVSP